MPAPLDSLGAVCSRLFSANGEPACRPFGSTCLLASYDHNGPQLYMVEPSGVAHVRALALIS